MKAIGIVTGGSGELPYVQKTVNTLRKLEIPCEIHVLSPHLTPGETAEYAQSARGRGLAAVIAFCGLSLHLAGAIAANTSLPVIAVPCADPGYAGADALRSAAHMTEGTPVAVVGLNASVNASIFAAQILAVDDLELAQRLVDHRTEIAENFLNQAPELRSMLMNETGRD